MMITRRRALHAGFAGMVVAVSLGLVVSAKTKTVVPDHNSEKITTRASAPRTAKDSLAGYDIAAGEDFLVSATPGHLGNVQAAADAAVYRPANGICSDSFTPAQMSLDDATAVTEDRSLMTMPVDLTLAPGTNPFAAVLGHPFEDDRPAGLFDSVGADALPASPESVCGFDSTPTSPPSPNLADRLYAPPAGPGPSTYAQMGLAAGGWALPAPSPGR